MQGMPYTFIARHPGSCTGAQSRDLSHERFADQVPVMAEACATNAPPRDFSTSVEMTKSDAALPFTLDCIGLR